MDSDSFKSSVKQFIELHDKLKESSKALTDLRKRKEDLGQQILQCMRENNIDECALADGKLIRKQSKRTEPLKKEHIEGELKTVLEPPQVNAAIEKMFGHRQTELKDVLQRTKKS